MKRYYTYDYTPAKGSFTFNGNRNQVEGYLKKHSNVVLVSFHKGYCVLCDTPTGTLYERSDESSTDYIRKRHPSPNFICKYFKVDMVLEKHYRQLAELLNSGELKFEEIE